MCYPPLLRTHSFDASLPVGTYIPPKAWGLGSALGQRGDSFFGMDDPPTPESGARLSPPGAYRPPPQPEQPKADDSPASRPRDPSFLLESFCNVSFSMLPPDLLVTPPGAAPAPPQSVYDFTVQDGAGHPVPMAVFRGQVLLIVNIPVPCGPTGQCAGLEALQRRFAGRPFTVVAFPCPQFGGRASDPDEPSADAAHRRLGATIPVMGPVDVNGPSAHPLWEHLKTERPGFLATRAIKWDFTKFLVDGEGRVRQRYASLTDPATIAPDVDQLLG